MVIDSNRNPSQAVVEDANGENEAAVLGTKLASGDTVIEINGKGITVTSTTGKRFVLPVLGGTPGVTKTASSENETAETDPVKLAQSDFERLIHDLGPNWKETLTAQENDDDTEHESPEAGLFLNFEFHFKKAERLSSALKREVRCRCRSTEDRTTVRRVVTGNRSCATYMSWMLSEPELKTESCNFL